jgi:hypothetical protein
MVESEPRIEDRSLGVDGSRRIDAMSGLIVVDCNNQLSEIAAALRAAGRFAALHYRGEEEGHEHANHGNDDEEFDECKARRWHCSRPHERLA